MMYNKKLKKQDGELILWHIAERLEQLKDEGGALWEVAWAARSMLRELLRSFR